MPIVFFIFLSAGMVALFAFIAHFHGKRVEAAWTDTANKLGLRYEPGGFLAGGRQISGNLNGQFVVVDTISRGSGNSRTTYTRFRVRYPNALGLGLRLTREGFFSGIGKFFGMQDIEVGDQAFDDQVMIKGSDPAAIVQFLTPGRRGLIVRALNSFQGLVIGDERIIWERAGTLTDANQITSTVQRLVTTANHMVDSPSEGPFERAATAHEQGRLDEARKALEDVPAEDPGHVDARRMETELLVANQQWKEAAPVVAELRALEPEDEEVTELEGLVFEHAEPVRNLEIEDEGDPQIEELSQTAKQVCADLFDSERTTIDTSRRFEKLYQNKRTTWTGTLERIDRHTFDIIFGEEGPVAVFSVYEIPEGFNKGQTVNALLQIDDVEAIESKIGEQMELTGTLIRCDAFMRNLYLAEGSVQPQG